MFKSKLLLLDLALDNVVCCFFIALFPSRRCHGLFVREALLEEVQTVASFRHITDVIGDGFQALHSFHCESAGEVPELPELTDPLVGDPLGAGQHGAAPVKGQRISPHVQVVVIPFEQKKIK